MPHFYFDSHDNDLFITDELGLDLPSLEAAKAQAAHALADIARDVLPGAVVRTITIEVRDDVGPVFSSTLRFEVRHARNA